MTRETKAGAEGLGAAGSALFDVTHTHMFLSLVCVVERINHQVYRVCLANMH